MSLLFKLTSKNIFPKKKLASLKKSSFYGNNKKCSFSIRIHPMSADLNIPTTSYDIDKIRNIGIIAHIDAGKTTTTERMLFYSGVISTPGEVHHGNTVTDYMEQERKRGITIRAAAISFDWKDHQVNLIDTPGHIDFTAEVERSLRVLDGAVVILDASMGVETQTITVWKQADKYALPKIAYINKIDKAGASVENTLLAMHKRLGVRPLLINFPTGEENLFTGLVDLISMKIYYFQDTLGLEQKIVDIKSETPNFPKYQKLREVLIEEIASLDEKILTLYLEGKEISSEDLILSIRSLLIENKVTIVTCGSSLKNKGVQQLLDSVVAFFPSPYDTPKVQASLLDNPKKIVEKHSSHLSTKPCGLIFKIINDKEKGIIAFFKLYQGILKVRSTIRYTNKTPNLKDRVVALLRMKADESLQLNEFKAGDIGAMIGLKEAKSGDTFVDEVDDEPVVLSGVYNPDPVFFCAITPKRNSDYRSLIAALEHITREDPSLRIKYDRDTAQTLICGLGELHLEIIKDRIEIEHGISSNLGKMKVSFKESLKKTIQRNFIIDKEINERKIFFDITLDIYPIESEYTAKQDVDVAEMMKDENEIDNQENDNKSFIFNISKYKDITVDSENPLKLNIKYNRCEISFDFENEEPEIKTIKDESGEDEIFKTLNLLNPDEKKKLFESILESLNSGSLFGYPLINVGVKILSGKYSTTRTDDYAMKIGVSDAMKSLIKDCDPIFMEPFMLVEVVVPNHLSSTVISDLSNRRGKIISIICENDSTKSNSKFNKEKFCYDFLFIEKRTLNKVSDEDIISKIYSIAPLSQMVGYSAFIRSISKGEGKFFMKFQEFDYVGTVLQGKILDGSYFYE
jgi:elongation factor G